ncbi:MAG: VanZ family protein [Weeksellaceae bacterium]|nr:VanZ family protein [Weeksellaceae bacterium]
MAKNTLFKILFYAATLLVLVITLMPLSSDRPGFLQAILFEDIDKVVHAGIFFLLIILQRLAWPSSSIWPPIIALLVYGLCIEYLQHTLPTGRSFDWWDWIFDGIGIIFGAIFYEYAMRRYLTTHSHSVPS